MTTKRDIRRWFAKGVRQNAKFMIVVCDTFDYGDYPIYTTDENFAEEYDKYNGKNLQKIMEVYNLGMDMESQVNEHRAVHFPENFKPGKSSVISIHDQDSQDNQDKYSG